MMPGLDTYFASTENNQAPVGLSTTTDDVFGSVAITQSRPQTNFTTPRGEVGLEGVSRGQDPLRRYPGPPGPHSGYGIRVMGPLAQYAGGLPPSGPGGFSPESVPFPNVRKGGAQGSRGGMTGIKMLLPQKPGAKERRKGPNTLKPAAKPRKKTPTPRKDSSPAPEVQNQPPLDEKAAFEQTYQSMLDNLLTQSKGTEKLLKHGAFLSNGKPSDGPESSVKLGDHSTQNSGKDGSVMKNDDVMASPQKEKVTQEEQAAHLEESIESTLANVKQTIGKLFLELF